MNSFNAVETPITAILAEDDPSLRPYISAMLQQQGLIVLAACNSREALTIFHDHPGQIDLLVTDVQLGDGINGVELAERLRRDRNDIAVLVISGTPESEQLAVSKGLPFLAKPFTLDRLRKRVWKVLEAGRSFDQGHTAID